MILERLKGIRAEERNERAMIHALSGSVLESRGERAQAEVEYLAAIRTWVEIGRDETTDAAVVFTSLGMLYTQEHRLEQAVRSVDRASAIFSKTRDVAPMDLIKLLIVRGMLHARLGEWLSAERDFCQGLSLADAQPAMGAGQMVALLNGLAEALKKNHHRQKAREIESRVTALLRASPLRTTIDVSDLVAPPKTARK
jgi:lipoprotein NlpI